MNLKRFLLVTTGTLVMALGLYFFLIPSKLATGGLTGFSIVLHDLVPAISIGSIMLVGNILLFVLAFLFIGPEFGGFTIYSSLLLSAMIAVFEKLMPLQTAPVNDVVLNLLFGTLIPAIGMAIIFHQNASTGGTDILAKIINKYFHMPIGQALMAVDFLIVMLAIGSFGLTLGLYALLGILINGVVIDNTIAGFNTRMEVRIISSKYETINDFILRNLDRGTTLYAARGGFSLEEKMVIETMVSKRQYIQIRDFVADTDREALMSVRMVHEVIGDGFQTFK